MPRAAVLGHPIAHSLSPVLHNAAYRALRLTDWKYSAIDMTAEKLGTFLDTEANNWAGFSLTMPLKVEVLNWIKNQSGAYQITDLAERVGAANTLGFGNIVEAFNTDVYGIVAAIREVIRHGPVDSIAILGAGATAASALAAAKELGARQVVVYARATSSRTQVRRVAENLGISDIVRHEELASAPGQLAQADAVISTLPAHAADPIAAQLVEASGALLDVVYDPNPTELVATWSALGGAVVGGERMLLHQAAKQVELMTGQPAPLAAMERALNAALTDQH